jgi:hypothetical protein
MKELIREVMQIKSLQESVTAAAPIHAVPVNG